jgi:hypothetical protein
VVVTLLFFGTNLIVYGTFAAHSTHSYSLCLFALFLRYTRIWSATTMLRHACVLGVIAGLIVFVRVNNGLFFVVFPLYGIVGISTMRSRAKLLFRNRSQLVWIALIALLMFTPQMLYWRHATGRWLIYSYGGYGFDFFRPAIGSVLFSFRGGMLFWSPVLVLSFIGIQLCRQKACDYWLPFLVYIPLQIYLVASWFDWAFGGGFGHRAFVEAYALMAFPMGALLASMRRRWQWVVLIIFCLCCVWWNLFFLKLYSTRELSYFGLDWPAFFDIFWSRKNVIINWWSMVWQ